MKRKLLGLFFSIAVATMARAETLTLQKGDHISLIGNALAERTQHDGWLETMIQSRFPEHELVFRNLGYAGDEIVTRLRSADFGSPDDHLTRNKADVVLAFFGYNESFGGEAGLPRFKKELGELLKHMLGQKYNGKSAPRIVLFSPVAHEDLHDPNLPDGKENNKRLALYTAAMGEVAAANGVIFGNIFAPSLEVYEKVDKPLTINGIHMTDGGNQRLAGLIESLLFGPPAAKERDAAKLKKLREAVMDKDFYWWERYRTVDGYSIYGGRADLKFVDGQTNRVVMQRELEVLDVMTANRDRRVWAVAQGRDLTVDDSNTPPFIPVKTNLPGAGPNGAHLFLGGDEGISKMQVGKGMKVNLFASEEMFPELANPVQIAFDPKGRLWVAVMPSYPHWKPKEEMNDKVVILEDTDGDGKADKCTTFADKLHVPTGLELWGGGLLLAQMPDLMFLRDIDGDDKADYRERVLHGLDSADTHHAMNSFVLDPGGALYFQEGTFHHTQVETPYGPPQRCANAGVFRYEPRTRKFEVYVSYGFANPHGHVFDRWGQDFVTDGTGNVNYYATAFSGRIDFPRKHSGMEPFFNQRQRPCPGTEILSSRHFPDEMQGNYLDGNVIGFQGILQYRFQDKDSGFTAVEVEPIVQSADPNFRPTDMEIGPDGALYFSDWQNPIIGHMQHNLRDPSRDRVHGRVYRLTYPSRPLLKPARIAGEPIEKLLDLLKEPENRVRDRARIELSGRQTEQVIAAARKWMSTLGTDDPNYEHHLVEALWIHQSHNVVDEALLKRLLSSEDFHARAAATRVLCYWRDRVADPLGLLEKMASDSYPRVRLEAVRACSFFNEARAAEVALLVLKNPMDYYLKYTLGETLAQLEPYWKKAVQEGAAFAANNPAGVDYILENVSTSELIKLPRTALVYQAFLSRDNVIHEYRHEALKGLAAANGTSVMAELLGAVERLDRSESAQSERVLQDLAHMLTSEPVADLQAARDRIVKLATGATRPFTRRVAYVALFTADGALDPTWNAAARSLSSLEDVLEAVPLIPDPRVRLAAHERIEPLLSRLPPELAAAAKQGAGKRGRYVRIELPRKGTLTLAEVQVLSAGANIAPSGAASQSTESNGGAASRAIDGNTSGRYGDGGQTHSAEGDKQPWWELDLRADVPIDSIVVWNRSEDNGRFAGRLDGYTLAVLDGDRQVIFQRAGNPAPATSVRVDLPSDPAGTIRRAAIHAIVSTGRDEEATFTKLAKMVRAGEERATATKALSRIPRGRWPQAELSPLVDAILSQVGKLSPDERTAPQALDSLQLGNDIAALLPLKQAQAARKALREIGVPVIVIHPVPSLMTFDRPQIYVEAGKPVQIVFENTDIMPHNLVITRPKALEKVGLEGERMAADPNAFAKSFVPNIPEVLFATKLLPPQQSGRLSFNAPNELGEYPFVCTFPGHWRRMNGVLRVVKSLDDVPPEALVAATATQTASRPFVREWKLEDLEPRMEHLERGRDAARGKKLFTEMACVQCHRVNGTGGQVGPDLAQVKEKLNTGKATLASVLTEMLEPSRVIDPKFRTEVIVLKNGSLLSAIVAEQTDKELRVRSNPLDVAPGAKSDELRVILLSEVEERAPSEVSLMPAGLLNTMSEDEILDLFVFVLSGGS